MDAAADRVQFIAREDGGENAECARQILQTPVAWSRWEQELGNALRPIAKYRSRMLQVRALRQTNFTWIHLAAPFRLLRRHHLRGEYRRRLISALHGPYAHYEKSVVAEHETYLRSVCHGFCAGHLGESVLGDALYRESMQRYQALYMEYFRAFAVFTCGKSRRAAAAEKVLPMMKSQLAEIRKALLQYPLRAAWLQREATIRKPTGDTQRLLRMDFNLR
jgi:hypothetical protein